MMNTNGFQSPLVSAVVRATSVSIRSASSTSASPSAVVPVAARLGGWKLASSLSGTIWRAEVSKVMTDRNAVSSAYGSCRSVETRICIPFLTASIGSPCMEPEVSSNR